MSSMMKRQVVYMPLALALGLGGWWLWQPDESMIVVSQPARGSESIERQAEASPDIDAVSLGPRPLPSPPRTSTRSLALDRQRARLHDTANRLRARRDDAVGNATSAATVAALDRHLVRVEQALAALPAGY